jgi:LPXTG-motif cell wall-anchored protein
MNAIRMVAVILIVAGVMGLAYGGFTYTRETHQAKIGPVDISVKDTQTVNVPIWAGIGAIVVGGLLLTVRRKS